jgi:hypothetical protein
MACNLMWYKFTDVSKELAVLTFYPEDGSTRFLLKIGMFVPDYIVSHPRRWQYS